MGQDWESGESRTERCNMEYIHLIGVEQIQSAANQMMRAAELMKRSADEICSAIDAHSLLVHELIDKLDKLEE